MSIFFSTIETNNLNNRKTADGKPIKYFEDATRALLENILQAAGLILNETNTESPSKPVASVSVLDVGFGCGDQIIALTELIHAHRRPHFRYVGLTLNEAQMEEAHRRLTAAIEKDDNQSNTTTNTLSKDSFSLFRADAAKPDSWPQPIRAAIASLSDETTYQERWFLGLDTLYHFSPSRKPIFTLAAQTLDANVMAFDLVLDEKATAMQTLIARLLSYFLGCPLSTFMTEKQYRAQLVECGYDEAQIEIRDITDCVFTGLAEFLDRQDAALSPYGIYMSGYKLAGRMYRWFGKEKMVKAVIVVGRTKKKDL